MTVVIIDYGSGNLRSVAKALERVADKTHAVKISSNPHDVLSASHVVLPGVGAFGDCRKGLDALEGMHDALKEAVQRQGKPFLGICVGMQLLADKGFEHGEYPGFGWIAGDVAALKPKDAALKIPHMGWNQLQLHRSHPVTAGIPAGAHAYFVHSYHYRPKDTAAILATTEYGGPVAAVIGNDNIVATQFHPEKSQETGLKLLQNFLAWKP